MEYLSIFKLNRTTTLFEIPPNTITNIKEDDYKVFGKLALPIFQAIHFSKMAQCELPTFYSHIYGVITYSRAQCLLIRGRGWFQNCKKWKWSNLKQKPKNNFLTMGLHLSNPHPLWFKLFKANNKFMLMNCIHVVMAQKVKYETWKIAHK